LGAKQFTIPRPAIFAISTNQVSSQFDLNLPLYNIRAEEPQPLQYLIKVLYQNLWKVQRLYRAMASLSMSSLSLNNQPTTSATTTMTIFDRFPQEVKDIIWAFSVEPEIIETKSKRKQLRGQSVKKPFIFKFQAGSVRVDLNGEILPISGIRQANKDSRRAYFKYRTSCIHLLKTGHKIYFNPSSDILHFGNIASIYFHMMRQRQRMPLPFLKGLHNAKKIAFDAEPDNEDYDDLAEEIKDDFNYACSKILLGWITKGKLYKKDKDWVTEVRKENAILKKDMKMRNIRLSGALGRVNGGYIDVGAKILRLPLTDMEGTEDST
jgi:hypothetical protein